MQHGLRLEAGRRGGENEGYVVQESGAVDLYGVDLHRSCRWGARAVRAERQRGPERQPGGQRESGRTGDRDGDAPGAERQRCPAVGDRRDPAQPRPAGGAADQRPGRDRAGLPHQRSGRLGQRQHRHPRRRADYWRGHHRLLPRRSAAAEAERLRLQFAERDARAGPVRPGPGRSVARPAGHPVRRELRRRHDPLHPGAAEPDQLFGLCARWV